MSERGWAHELNTGIAAALGLFDPPDTVDEKLLASVLRQVANESDDLGGSLFLRALADAFDNPNAALRLTLGKGRRGRPSDTRKSNERWRSEQELSALSATAGRRRQPCMKLWVISN